MNGRWIAVVSTVVAVLFGLTSAWGCTRSYSSVLKANRGFSLPSGCPEIYEKDSGISFNGDGLRYHVFAYREEQPVNEMFEWSDQEDRTIFYSSYREAVSEWLNDIGVPLRRISGRYRVSVLVRVAW